MEADTGEKEAGEVHTMRRFASLIVVLLLVSLSTSAQSSSIAGRVTDTSGAAIDGAHIVVHWDRSGAGVGVNDNVGIPQDLTVMTDKNGTYSASVPPGFYDVFITAMAFSPVATKVRVKKRSTAHFDVKLKLADIVMRELD